MCVGTWLVITTFVGVIGVFVGIWLEHSTMKAWPFSRYTWRIRELEAKNAHLRQTINTIKKRNKGNKCTK